MPYLSIYGLVFDSSWAKEPWVFEGNTIHHHVHILEAWPPQRFSFTSRYISCVLKHSALTKVCRQIHSESREMYYASHSFVLHLPDNVKGDKMTPECEEAVVGFAADWLESLGSRLWEALLSAATNMYQ